MKNYEKEVQFYFKQLIDSISVDEFFKNEELQNFIFEIEMKFLSRVIS